MQDKRYISWQEDKARILQLVNDIFKDIPVLGSIAAVVLIDTFPDGEYILDFSDILKKKSILALIVNGDSMIDACMSDGDVVSIETIMERIP